MQITYKNISRILILVLLFISNIGYAQKLGYKDIEIGKSIGDTSISKYYFKSSSSDPNRYVALAVGSTFCNITIHAFQVDTDSNKKIKRVILVTRETKYSNRKSLILSFQNTVDCVSNWLGKPDVADEAGKNLYNAWMFPNEPVAITLMIENMGDGEVDKNASFEIVWRTKEQTTMW